MAACVLLGSLCLLGAGPNTPASAGSGGEPPAGAAWENESVLVEAFVVEVNLPALRELGVSPIGRHPHAVTVADLLKCLDDGRAHVIGGGKIAARNGAKVSVETQGTIYVQRPNQTPRLVQSPRASGARLTVDVRPVTETSVSVEFGFTTTRFIPEQTEEGIPSTGNWAWDGQVVLRLGEPQIAGATQDGKTAVFLLLVAHTQD